MNIHFICIGTKMPSWVTQGYQEYAKRLPQECTLKLIEIQPGHRGKGADLNRAMRDEGERMIKAIPRGTHIIALDVKGKSLGTEALAQDMEQWMHSGQDIALLVGGPEGLAPECLQMAQGRWSLSALTLPHPLVRIVVAEQLYRAWSILKNHPYHRS
jgi:23S rRNA (pseudouridine1915-N3)-methyltransferase